MFFLQCIDTKGQKQTKDFGEVSFESEYDEMWKAMKQTYEDAGYPKTDFDKDYGYLSKEKVWSGFMGVTLHPSVPKNFKGFGKSTSENHQVIMNARTPEKKTDVNTDSRSLWSFRFSISLSLIPSNSSTLYKSPSSDSY